MNTGDEEQGLAELAELRVSRDTWRRTAWVFAWDAEQSRAEIERLRRRIAELEAEIRQNS